AGDLLNGTIAVGNGAVWVLDQDGVLWRIDPASSRLTGRFETNAPETSVLVPAAGYEWIGERLNHAVLRYDPARRQAKTFHFGQQPWRLVGVESPNARSIWLVDAQATRSRASTRRRGAQASRSASRSDRVRRCWPAAASGLREVTRSTASRCQPA